MQIISYSFIILKHIFRLIYNFESYCDAEVFWGQTVQPANGAALKLKLKLSDKIGELLNADPLYHKYCNNKPK